MTDGLNPLPEKYGVEKITLLIRDPYCLFAFWETDASGGHLELYGTDPSGMSRHLIDNVPVGEVGSRTMTVPVAGAYYVARLAFAHRPPVESTVVMTPPAGPSPFEDETSPAIHSLRQWHLGEAHVSSHSFATKMP